MGVYTTRTPENLDAYLKMLIREGHASTYGNAINLIILERMMADKKRGEIAPFKYRLIDHRKNPPGPPIADIKTDNIEEPATFPLGEAPPIAGPEPATRDSLPAPEIVEIKASEIVTDKTEYNLPKASKPVYPGTKAQWEKEPLKNLFEPPED